MSEYQISAKKTQQYCAPLSGRLCNIGKYLIVQRINIILHCDKKKRNLHRYYLLLLTFKSDMEDGDSVQYLRSAVMINPVDLASNEDTDLAFLPPLLVGEQVGDEQGQTWTRTSNRFTTQSTLHPLCLTLLKFKYRICKLSVTVMYS